LAPAPGRGAKINAAYARAQQPLALLDFLELVDSARTPAFFQRALDVLIARVLGKPSGAALGALRHRSTGGPAYNGPMPLSEKQKKYLRRLAHPLHPLVMLGNSGLTEGVLLELDRALADHELVKVSVRLSDRAARNAALASLSQRTSSELVQHVGHVGVYYRQNRQSAKIIIPDQ
jgi:RNA-binding protein